MNKVKKATHKIVAVFTLGMLFFMCCPIITGVVQRIFTISKSTETNQWTASEYYPLENNSEKTRYGMIKNVLDKIEAVEQKIEKKVTSFLPFRASFILAKKACDKAIGLDMTTSLCSGENDLTSVGDIVLEYEKDYLCFVMDNADISEKVESLMCFGSQMKSEGRDFLFFMPPGKYKGNEIYQDYSEEKEKEVVMAFEEKGLDMVYLPDRIKKEDMISLFFKTDHHWLPSTGIWADKMLCEILNEKYDYQFDTSIFNMGYYKTDILEEDFLGSQGKKITEVYCQKEDFPIIVPEYDTDLEVFISGRGKTCYGTIQDTLLHYSVLNEKDSSIRNNYAFYGYGDQALITVHNNKIDDGSNILIIKMSFADCMYPYLAAVVEDLHIIDLRIFNGSLQSYIRETNPDTVIVIYGIMAFENQKSVLFDFR
ncbi:MAG: DHHW family protein [Roseburia sp.]|nr:DHHW family protein [Roseburia sp.]MCM1202070.1 DHHW family protein [Bacteroides fragilis]